MPIITTLVIARRPSAALMRPPARCWATHTWPMISALVRLRWKPCLPVEQKLQSSEQPTWDETHRVRRVPLSAGISTVST